MYDVTRQAIGLLVSEILVAASVPSRNSRVSSHRMGVAMLVNDLTFGEYWMTLTLENVRVSRLNNLTG